jgi:hypothetical protein
MLAGVLLGGFLAWMLHQRRAKAGSLTPAA